MRELRQTQSLENSSVSAISNLISIYHKNESNLLDTLSGLISLCSDDKSHAIDLGRRGGLVFISEQIAIILNKKGHNSDPSTTSSNENDIQITSNIMNKCIRCIAAACTYPEFVRQYIHTNDTPGPAPNSGQALNSGHDHNILLTEDFKSINFVSYCNIFLCNIYKCIYITATVQQTALTSCIQILKHLPLTINDSQNSDPNEYIPLYLSENIVKKVMQGFLSCILYSNKYHEHELFSIATEAFTACISEQPQYINTERLVDHRLESLTERKQRLHTEKMLRYVYIIYSIV